MTKNECIEQFYITTRALCNSPLGECNAQGNLRYPKSFEETKKYREKIIALLERYGISPDKEGLLNERKKDEIIRYKPSKMINQQVTLYLDKIAPLS